MSIELKRARPEHVAGIRRVCAASWRDAYGELLPDGYIERAIETDYSAERIAREVREPTGWDGWLVATAEGRVVGAGGGGVEGSVGEVIDLHVAPDRRREGIGSRLLEAMTDRQRERGARDQRVSVVEGNDGARRFYEQAGFVVEGREESDAVDAAALQLWRSI